MYKQVGLAKNTKNTPTTIIFFTYFESLSQLLPLCNNIQFNSHNKIFSSHIPANFSRAQFHRTYLRLTQEGQDGQIILLLITLLKRISFKESTKGNNLPETTLVVLQILHTSKRN